MQSFLLDTHTLLWWLADDYRLGPRCRELLGDPRNQAFVSAASTWEIAIKAALGKLEAPEDMDSTPLSRMRDLASSQSASIMDSWQALCPLSTEIHSTAC